MGLHWISSNKIRKLKMFSVLLGISLAKPISEWKKQSFICQEGEGDTWAWSSPYKRAVATKWCLWSLKKKKVARKGDAFIPFAPAQTQQASWILHHLRWLHACKISTIQVLQEFFHRFWTLLKLKFKSDHCPKKKHWCESLLLVVSDIILLISSLQSGNKS